MNIEKRNGDENELYWGELTETVDCLDFFVVSKIMISKEKEKGTRCGGRARYICDCLVAMFDK